MTVADNMNRLIDIVIWAYKINMKGTIIAEYLNQKRQVRFEESGIVVSCWREYGIVRTAEFVQETIPEATVEVHLEGNDSRIELTCDTMEERTLAMKVWQILKGYEEKMKNIA